MFEELIKEQLKMLGLDEGLASQITVTNEADVPRAVMQFAVNRGVESEADRRANKAVETNTEKLRKEYDAKIAELEKKQSAGTTDNSATPPSGDGNSQTPDIAALISQGINEGLKPLSERLEKLETSTVEKDRTAKIHEALKAEGLPETAAKYISSQVESDDQIDQAVKAFSSDFGALKQAEKDKELDAAGGIPRSRGAKSISEQAAIDAAKARSNPATASLDGTIKGVDLLNTSKTKEKTEGE